MYNKHGVNLSELRLCLYDFEHLKTLLQGINESGK